MTLELCKTIAKEVSFDDHTIGLCPQTQVRAFPLELAQKLELESYNVRVWNIFTFIEMIYPQIWKKKHSWKASKPLARNALLKTVNSVSRDSQWKTLRFEENKINCFRRDQSLCILSDLLYSWKLWSWKFIKPRCNGGRRWTFKGNSAFVILSDVIDFAMLPTQSFWRETVLLLDVMWPRGKQWVWRAVGEKFPAI